MSPKLSENGDWDPISQTLLRPLVAFVHKYSLWIRQKVNNN